MIAAVCAWHEHHALATEEIERRFSQDETLIVAAPALVEAYAVLTRLPPPHRLSPEDALALLEADFIHPAKLVTLDRKAYVTLLRRAPHDGILGGRTYDAVIAACALKGKVATILTFNEQHFLPFAEWGMAIVVPGKSR
jgi:predicted nucleic acid-binding protein